MENGCCTCRKKCTLWAGIISLAAGIVTAFLQSKALIKLPAAVPAVAFVLAAVYLATVLVVAVLLREQYRPYLGVRGLLAGTLITALAAAVLAAVPLPGGSLAVVTGALAAGLGLMLTTTACLVGCLTA